MEECSRVLNIEVMVSVITKEDPAVLFKDPKDRFSHTETKKTKGTMRSKETLVVTIDQETTLILEIRRMEMV